MHSGRKIERNCLATEVGTYHYPYGADLP